MVKRNVTLHLTHENIMVLTARGVNISQKVDEFLSSLISVETEPSEELAVLGEELKAKTEAERLKVEREAKAQRVKPYTAFYRKQMGEVHWQRHPEERQEWLDKTCESLGMKEEEFLKWVSAT